ncbi:helix-turn-helix transcriptional regulator [uncultured Roseobacter sp.]|uniref:helix-turn-helix domain-containing protein n=1 Tax=uncultured Roseobacter sp. TaxID=114847 RepID=UPI00345B3228
MQPAEKKQYCSLSMSYISFLETCRRQPTLTVMDAICRELGVSLTEFVNDVEREVENSK